MIRLAGLDISKKHVDIACTRGKNIKHRRFANRPAGRKKLIEWLTHRTEHARVVLEATGIYHLDLALDLAETPGVEVMVLNPRQLRHFGEATQRRAKTDPLDARLALEYVRHMDFVAWTPPSSSRLALRVLSRRIDDLSRQRSAEMCRHEALKNSRISPRIVVEDVEDHIQHLQQRIERLRAAAHDLIDRDQCLARQRELLESIKGVARASSIPLLAELGILPEGLTVRQWVAMAGLDPRVCQSGNKTVSNPRISRRGNAHVRKALFMPAIVAIRCQDHFKDFYNRLVERGKPKRVAQVAAMRKLLHCIYGIFKNDQPFDPEKLFPKAQIA